MQGLVAFIQYGDLTYRFLGYTPAGQLQANDETFRRAIGSFSELKDQSKLNVEPYRVELVKIDREMSMEEFNRKYPSTIPIERLAVVNGLDAPPDRIPSGTTVKRVVGGKGAPALREAAPAERVGSVTGARPRHPGGPFSRILSECSLSAMTTRPWARRSSSCCSSGSMSPPGC